MRLLTDEEVVERLIEAGWDREAAKKEVEQMLKNSTIDAGQGWLVAGEEK